MKSSDILQKVNSLGQRQVERSAYKWLDEQKRTLSSKDLVRVPSNILLPGKIHTFNYNPKHKDTLDYYDKNPVVLSLGNLVRNKHILEMGINLNFIPTPFKWQFLETLYRIHSGFFKSVNSSKVIKTALNEPIINYKYHPIKNILDRYGFSFAIRTYIPSRKSNTYVFSYKSWETASLLSIEDFEGITYNQMIREFKEKLQN